MKLDYEGFQLQSAVEQHLDSGEWTTRVLITKHHANQVKEKFCSASNTFKDKAEAERHSIEFGKQVVDGRFRNATITDLL